MQSDCKFVTLHIMQSFRIIRPSKILSPYIHHYWILKDDSPIIVTERVIPIGSVQLVFHRNQRLRIQKENAMQPQSFVGGQAMTYYDVASTGDLNMIVVVLQPYAAQFLLHRPAHLFNGLKVSINDTSDMELMELSKKIINHYDDNVCIGMIEEFLVKRLQNIPLYEQKRWKAVQQEINVSPQADIASLSDIACLSERQFRRTFNENFGITPKQFLRTVRMQRALHMMEHQPDITFTQLAYDCAFTDQSHMIKEFKLFSGYSPKEYLKVCAPVSEYFF